MIRAHLDSLLQSKNPMPGLIDYQNRIAATVDRLIQEDCWPFQPPFDTIMNEINRLEKHYAESYGSAWTDLTESS